MLEEALIEVALEDKYGKTEIANAGKILRILWEEVGAEAFEEWVRRGALLVQSKAFLLDQLCQQGEDAQLPANEQEDRQSVSKQAYAEDALRGMWEEWQNSGSPHRRKPAEQLTRKLDKTLLELSRETASVEKLMCCVRIATKGEGFMPEALSADAEIGKAGESAAGDAEGIAGGSGGAVAFGYPVQGTDLYNHTLTGDKAASLNANSGASATRAGPGVCYALDQQGGKGGANNQAIVFKERAGCPGGGNGILCGDKPFTLSTLTDQAVCCAASFMGGQGSNARSIAWTEEATPPLKSVPSGSNTVPDVCYPIDSHQQDSRFKICADGISPTLPGQMGTGGNNGPMVLTYRKTAHPRNADEAQGWEPTDKADTLNVFDNSESRTPTAVVETYQKVTGPLMANSHPGSYSGQDAYSDMLVTQPAKPPRKHIIRRLTPLECVRLQGLPDWWLDGVDGSDSAKYKMIGNGIAMPNAIYVVGCAVQLLQEGKHEKEG